MFEPVTGRGALPCLLISLTVATPLAAVETMDDIVVTARKREENLQEIPLSITALTSAQLESRGITNNYEVALFTPNFTTQKQVGRTLDRPTIRGMAASSTQGEPNASYFIDGVYVSSSIATATTDAIERVEALRGPQSAQFGRATFSGAVAYVTRKPSETWEGEVNLQAGQDDDYKAGAWVSGPLIQDKLAFLASAAWEQWDGEWRNNLQQDSAFSAPNPPFGDFAFIDAPTRGDRSKMGGEETKDLLLKTTWTPREQTEVNLKFGYTRGNDDHFPSLAPPPGEDILNCFLPGPSNPDSGGAYCGTWDPSGWRDRVNIPDLQDGLQGSAIANPDPPATPEDRYAPGGDVGLNRDTYRFFADVTQGVGDWDLVGRAAYNKDDFDALYDLDHSEVRALAGLFNFEQRDDQHDYSFETRLVSPGDGRLQGIVGLYYYFYERNRSVRSITGPSIFFQTFDNDGNLVTTAFPTNTRERTENKAIFGSIDYDIIPDKLTFSFEGRWAEDDKKIRGGNLYPDQANTTNFTPRYILRYQINDDTMVYGLAAKGVKPTDFNSEFYRYDILRSGTQTAVENGDAQVSEEEQWTYEIGTKNTLFDSRLVANLSAFYIDWDNQAFFTVVQIDDTISGQPLTTTIRENAGSTEIYGLEFESNLLVTDEFTLIANYGYTHSEFKEGSDTFLLDTTGDGDLKGKHVPDSPEHSVVLGGLVTKPINAEFDLTMRLDYIYESERYVQAANLNKLSDRKLVNFRAGVGNDTWTITGYVDNLLDDDTPWAALNFVDFARTVGGNTAETWSLSPSRGRNYGVQFRYRFAD